MRMMKFLFTLSAATWFTAPDQANSKESETRRKSEYIMKFAQHITWPSGYLKEGAPFKIIVLASPAMLEEMKKVVINHDIQGLPVEVSGAVVEAPAIIVVDPKSGDWPEIQRKFSGKPVLLVNGGVQTRAPFTIQFFMQDKRLRFEISQKSVKAQNLKITSQLMKLGVVKD